MKTLLKKASNPFLDLARYEGPIMSARSVGSPSVSEIADV